MAFRLTKFALSGIIIKMIYMRGKYYEICASRY